MLEENIYKINIIASFIAFTIISIRDMYYIIRNIV